MAFDAIRRTHPILFSLLTLFAIIELSIAAWLISRYNSHHNYLSTSVRNRTRYLLFCAIWTTLLVPLFLMMFLLASGHFLSSVASHGIFLFITWALWLAGAAAITNALGGRLNCSRHFVYCGQLNALEAFAWIEWALLTLALLSVIWWAVKGRQSGRDDGRNGNVTNGSRGPVTA